MSFARLQDKIDELANPAVVGLDPAIGMLPPYIIEDWTTRGGGGLTPLECAAHAFLEFNKGIIDAICDIVPAVKPQAAFYEMLGSAGIDALRETAAYANRKGLYVIADAKRGDIGSTAEAYSGTFLGKIKLGNTETAPYKFDAVTVNGYLGRDGILPFLNDAVKYDKALFVLVKTSNPSSGDIQDLMVGDKRVYEIMGELIEELAKDTIGPSGYTRIGAVVGATYPEELKAMRRKLNHTFFLVPGYGAQGGTARDVVHAFDANKRGAVINSSRGIIGAWKKTGNDGRDYAEAARAAALRMRDDLRESLGI